MGTMMTGAASPRKARLSSPSLMIVPGHCPDLGENLSDVADLATGEASPGIPGTRRELGFGAAAMAQTGADRAIGLP